jgi:regulator of protease activity HflC (stomatin/prohibitin superfamily)
MRTPLILTAIAATAVLASGCATATVEPGHRALLFAPDRGGLQREVLQPGVYSLHGGARVEDFAVTYARRDLPVRATTRDGRPVAANISVVYRPIIAELYSLEVEEGPNYYDTVIAPEVLDAAREVLEKSTAETDFTKTSQLDSALETAARRRVAGKHVEIAQVVVDKIEIAP